MKWTSYKMFHNQEFLTSGGPTLDNLPPIQWSKIKIGKDTPILGILISGSSVWFNFNGLAAWLEGFKLSRLNLLDKFY